MGKKRKLQKNNYASFYRLTGGWIKPPMSRVAKGGQGEAFDPPSLSDVFF